MAVKNSIDDNGVLYLYNKIKGEMPKKTSELTNDSNSVQDANYVHTEENFSTELKTKLNSTGTAAMKNSTNAVTSGSTDLVESGAVSSAIAAAVSGAYRPGGTKTCAELLPALLIADNKGFMYNMSDSGITTEYFLEGAGKPIYAGQDVAIVETTGGVYKFNVLGGTIDLSGYMLKTDIHWMTNAEIEELLSDD